MKMGYTFAGWTLNGVLYNFSTPVKGNIELVASWTINKYTVTFNVDGVKTTAAVNFGGTVTKPANPTKTGYTFAGWTFDGEAFDFATNVTSNIELVATWKINLYTVTFIVDGVETTATVNHNSTVAQPINPVKEGATFADWLLNGSSYDFTTPVTQDITLMASWTTNTYAVKFVNEDGALLYTATVAHGATPVYNGETPVKVATAQYTYTFAGWTPEITAATGATTYTATYTETVNKYTVTFKNGDDVLASYEVAYGTVPEYVGATPVKAATAQYTYTFAGWNEALVAVTGEATYTAKFTETVNKYTIKFVNEDGTVLQEGKVAYGEVPEYVGETPVKAATAQYTYTFKAWDSELVSVAGDATYTATYTETLNKYKVTFKNGDDVLASYEVEYGTVPKYVGETPVKAATAQYTYTFAGWNEALVAVTGEATYTAKFTETVNEYTITFVNEDGTVLQEGKVAYGEVPAYNGELPTKDSTDLTNYAFAGWTPTIVAVTGEATYTATFTDVTKEYTIKFVDENGNELYTAAVAYGMVPEYKGEAPTKAEDGEYTYTFAGWTPELVAVTGEATYTATYTKTAIVYTVTYKDGAEIVEKVKYTVETANTITLKGELEKTGYTFNGWYEGETKVETLDLSELKNIELIANWTINTYTVTYMNGTYVYTTQTYTVKTESLTLATAPTAEEGYTFNGWYEGETKVETLDLSRLESITLTAKWTKKVYEVKFDVAGVETQNVEHGATATEPAAPTQEGKKFVEWQLDGVAYDFETPVTKAITLTAVWKDGWDDLGGNTPEPDPVEEYEVSFNVDGDSTVIATQTVSSGELAAAPNPVPTKNGYTFAYWTLDGAEYDFNTPVERDIELVAVWTINTYTVTFDTDGGEAVEAVTVNYGTPATELKAITTTKTGYTFNGWTLENGTAIPEGAVVTEDITVKAAWTINEYTITFNYDDNTLYEEVTVKHGETPSVDNPTKEATAEYTYTFTGWTPEIAAATGATTYTAVFTSSPRLYTVTFVNGEDTTTKDVAYNKKVTAPELTKDGYALSWLLNSDVYDFENNTVTEPITLTASWTVIEYEITYTMNEGHFEDGVAYPTTYTIKSETIVLVAPVKEGYEFKGWLNDVNGQVITEITAGSTGDLALTASWVKVWNVTFDVEGYAAQIVEDGKTATKPETDPVKDGYNFVEWQFNGEAYDFTAAVNADITLTAKFEEQQADGMPKENVNYWLAAADTEKYPESYAKATNSTYLDIGPLSDAITVTFEKAGTANNEFYIKLSTGEYVNDTAVKKLAFGEKSTIWVLTIDADANTKTISPKDKTYVLQYNNSSPRITTYAGTQQNVWFTEARERTDAEKVAEDKEKLTFTSTTTTATLLGANGSTITWKSSDSAVLAIAEDGTVTVTAPTDANAEVIVTATLTLGEATDTKEFTVTVAKVEEGGTQKTLQKATTIDVNEEYYLMHTVDGTTYYFNGTLSSSKAKTTTSIDGAVKIKFVESGTAGKYYLTYEVSGTTKYLAWTSSTNFAAKTATDAQSAGDSALWLLDITGVQNIGSTRYIAWYATGSDFRPYATTQSGFTAVSLCYYA